MREWTEQEEQEMIELARQGDPKANYELSLWALQRSEEEPGESRWNRLAAKCLIKAANAGYAPAQERMQELLHPSRTDGVSRQEREAATREPVRLSDARAAAAKRSQAPVPESTARRPMRLVPDPVDEQEEDDYDDRQDEYVSRPERGARNSRREKPARPPRREPAYEPDEYGDDEPDDGGRARWGERQWRRVEIICVAVCALLLVLIAVMILTSRRSGGGDQTNPTVPVAGDATSATNEMGVSPSPDPGPYPDEATLADIEAADLDVYPADTEYVTVPTTATVKVDSQSLRLRSGPSTTYGPPICEMADGTTVQVYAIKNNWDLVYYEGGEDGPVYGWCSGEYLIVTSGAADNSSVG